MASVKGLLHHAHQIPKGGVGGCPLPFVFLNRNFCALVHDFQFGKDLLKQIFYFVVHVMISPDSSYKITGTSVVRVIPAVSVNSKYTGPVSDAGLVALS
jgi:hypothetical protein